MLMTANSVDMTTSDLSTFQFKLHGSEQCCAERIDVTLIMRERMEGVHECVCVCVCWWVGGGGWSVCWEGRGGVNEWIEVCKAHNNFIYFFFVFFSLQVSISYDQFWSGVG